MNITYENHGDYYIFSDNPDTRVYLGDIKPDDYIHDVIEQAKRSESCYYYEIATGKKVNQEEAFDKSLEKGEHIWYEDDEDEGYTYGFKCDYDFKRKTSLGTYGMRDRSCKYNQKNKAMKRLANAYVFNITLEEQDTRDEGFRLEREKFKRENPALYNLMMVSGETYYVDDNGNRITIEEHFKRMKAELGDDCFEIANAKIDPEIKAMVSKIFESKGEGYVG